ncbi:hypothetical protein [Sanguibacter suaedae]|uniref:Uncharacterized protein n=1 Tax=Sanguibacter suaedae TaxID=2795737 RepID=A0A934MCY5_9MICO|nr:hypothetical protein [Sanguibacter suaedae]MBI9114299.1 hypothetical protein [Sanguibacter suaedae]
MGAAEWISIGTVAVALVAVLSALFHGDRSLARVEAIREARALVIAGGLSTNEEKQLKQFIKFTSHQLSNVWWRTPYTGAGVVALLAALAAWGSAFAVMNTSNESVSVVFWLAIAYTVIGIVMLIVGAVIQARRGYKNLPAWTN